MSQNLKLEIRIDANGNAQAYIAGTNERLGKLSDKTKETASAFDTLNNSMARIAQWSIALEAIGIAVTGIPQKLIEEASAMEQLNIRLKSGAETTAEYIANKQYLLETSNRLSVDLATLTDGFSKMQIVQASGVLTTQESKQILEGLTNEARCNGGRKVWFIIWSR